MADCPSCGEPLPRRARACPECGSDERTGWRSAEDVDYESVALPEDEDYEDTLAREGLGGGAGGRRRPRGSPLWIAVTAAVVAAAVAAAVLLR